MQIPLDVVALVATIIGPIASLVALLQSRAWLMLMSIVLVCLSLAAGLYARKQRRALKAASTVVEGHTIDSLNVANLRRRVNRTLVVQEALHLAVIEGDGIEITWRYSGFCRAENETKMDFSVDADANTTFEELDCIAFDRISDAEMTRPIRPLLVGSDGFTRKIQVPLLKPLKKHDPFAVQLQCKLLNCLNEGFEYYTSTLSFGHDSVCHYETHLTFRGALPKWLRVYECSQPGKPRLLKSLAPVRSDEQVCEYRDVEEELSAPSLRVYAFWRGF